MSLIIKTTGFDDYLDQSGGGWLKVLIMGDPDVGKTRSASFWPKPIFADCEDGRMSIADRGVPYARIRSTAEMEALVKELKKDALRPPEVRKYLTLVLDTFDAYQRIAIQERLLAERKESFSGWADWGWLENKMSSLIEQVLNLGMNIVVNLHVKDETIGDEDSKMKVARPRLKGDVKDSILQEFDLIGHMETSYEARGGQRTRVRHIRWHNEPAYPALKDRSGRLPRFTEIDFTEKDYSRIFEAITGAEWTDSLPESQEVDSIDVDEEELVEPPDKQGGPVDPGKLPQARGAKKAASPADRKAAAKKAAAKKTTAKKAPAEKKAEPKGEAKDEGSEKASTPVPTPEEKPEPTPEPETTAPAEPPAETEVPTDEQAQKTVEEKLGAEVVEEETPKAENARVGLVCGSQPDSHKSFEPGHPGCGRDLSTENPAKVNLSLLRAKVRLCASCLEDWKTAS